MGAAPPPARVGEFRTNAKKKLVGLLQKFCGYAILFRRNHTLHTPKASIESKSSRLNPWDGIGEVKLNRLKKGRFTFHTLRHKKP